MDEAKELLQFIGNAHDSIPDKGCKSSCWYPRVSLEYDAIEKSFKWICEFCGYCFSNLSRHERVEAASFESLKLLVETRINQSLKEMEHDVA